MVSAVVEYFRNIAGFLVFAGVAGVLAPKRFSQYIKLAAGLVTVILAVSPLARVLNGNWVYTPEIPKIEMYGGTVSDGMVGERIAGEYKKALERHLEDELAKRAGETGFIYRSAVFHINEDYSDEYFGEIYGVTVILAETAPEAAKRPFIYVEKVQPITILPNVSQENQDLETELTKDIKKVISDFYNLSINNINIMIEGMVDL
jgi:hypothetical protein